LVGPGVLGKDRSWAQVSLSCLGIKDPLLAGSFPFERNPSRFDWHVFFHQSKSVPVLQQPVGTSFGTVPVTNVEKQGGLVPVTIVKKQGGLVPVTIVKKQGGLVPVPKG